MGGSANRNVAAGWGFGAYLVQLLKASSPMEGEMQLTVTDPMTPPETLRNDSTERWRRT